MRWINVENKFKEENIRQIVMGNEMKMREILLAAVSEEYPFFDKEKIERTIDRSLKNGKQPVKSEKLLAKLKDELRIY